MPLKTTIADRQKEMASTMHLLLEAYQCWPGYNLNKFQLDVIAVRKYIDEGGKKPVLKSMTP